MPQGICQAHDHPLAHPPTSPHAPLQYAAPPGERLALAAEYLALVAAHPVPLRMVRGHVHKLMWDWLAEHTDLRERINRGVPSLGLFTEVRVGAVPEGGAEGGGWG